MSADTTRRDRLVAGSGLLVMGALAVPGYMVAVQGLVTPGDATRTAIDLQAAEGLFRLGIVALLLVVVLDVVVAWALQQVFNEVDSGISLLAAVLRLVYAGVYLVAIAQLVAVPRLLGGADHLATIAPQDRATQALSAVSAFEDIWSAGLVLFGAHLVVLGWLVYRSGFAPRLLGALVVLAGLGYAYDSIATVLIRGDAPQIASVTFLGEVLLALWLLVRSRPADPRGRAEWEFPEVSGRGGT